MKFSITPQLYKYISTTLPYANSTAHIGHTFEFVLADVISEYYQRCGYNVIFNVGVDEHGAKIHKKALEEGYENTQEYCDIYARKWKEFCHKYKIDYTNFYRTTSKEHKENFLKIYERLKNNQSVYTNNYTGKYCTACESFVTEKEIVNDACPQHPTLKLDDVSETNEFFKLSDYQIVPKQYLPTHLYDVLVDKSRSAELHNLTSEPFDLSITRENVKWGIPVPNTENSTFYVWGEALCNYPFAAGYFTYREQFEKYWDNSLIICGKDNLKFQAYVLQALLKASGIKQTKEVLVHGIILDKDGTKMSKSLGNVIDPIEQLDKFGLDPVRYYLTFGLNTFSDSKYSEEDLVAVWNGDVVNGYGNLVSRTLHLIDIKGVTPINGNLHNSEFADSVTILIAEFKLYFERYDFKSIRNLFNRTVSELNKRFLDEKPFDKDCTDYERILSEIYTKLKVLSEFLTITLKDNADAINEALYAKELKKVILFKKLEISE